MGSSQPVCNFGAGPAKLPKEVLIDVQKELISYNGSGMSLMEMSHRSKEYSKINSDAQQTIRRLLNVPENYKVLFMQGGGTGAFAAVALNLIGRTGRADYAVTGTWSGKAYDEGQKFGQVNLVFPKAAKPGSVPPFSTWKLDSDASYLYYCDNETVDGVQFHEVPTPLTDVPLVCDMSSSIMTKPVDVSKFGVIFAGAQKNIGPAGVTVVIIRDDLLGAQMQLCPSVFDFSNIAKQNSIHNTPATFSVYVMEKVLKWIEKNGGILGMQKQSLEKSTLLYDTLAKSNKFYTCPIDRNVQSKINIPFRVKNDEKLEDEFLKEAERRHMFQLKGHRSVGGIRASLYNAVSLEDVQCLVGFMLEFQKQHM